MYSMTLLTNNVMPLIQTLIQIMLVAYNLDQNIVDKMKKLVSKIGLYREFFAADF